MKHTMNVVTSEWDEAEVWLRAHDRPACAWCHEPIMAAEYYSIDGEAVCRDCVEACRRTNAGR
ncbi:MAG: hypothetical protein IKI63_02185 [Clostridia bacterium]|nr:hypothetical protein [Clostridia bacterium]